MIVVEDEDSCGKSETGKTPQERSDEEAYRPPAESEVFHGNQKRQFSRFFKSRHFRKGSAYTNFSLKSLIDFPKQTI
ncbi:hypothetical protein ACQ0QQ_17575 [Lysinibacillus sphaericus]